MDLHPEIAELEFLLGEWSGNGVGDYPTIEAFEYSEVVTFGHVGKPFVAYTQRTRRAGSGEPLHAETGYFRPAGPGQVELVLAQPSGIVEVDVGTVKDGLIALKSETVGLAPTAKVVNTVERQIEVVGDILRYELWMGAVDQAHQLHLRAELHRQ